MIQNVPYPDAPLGGESGEALEAYLAAHSDPEPPYLAVVNRRTHVRMINPRMMSGHLQGRFLAMLSHMVCPRRVLELGTFSGYSALCLAEGLAEDGLVHTVEHDDELEDFIRDNLALSPLADRIRLHIGDALEVLAGLEGEVFDLVFIDADKRQYTDYYEAVLPRVRPGGFILADNTLWDGKLLHAVRPGDKQALALLHFNDHVVADARVEKLLLPLRDGLTIIRKK